MGGGGYRTSKAVDGCFFEFKLLESLLGELRPQLIIHEVHVHES